MGVCVGGEGEGVGEGGQNEVGWLKVNMTQAAEHWTLFPSSNVGMVLRVLNRKGDEGLEGEGVGRGRGGRMRWAGLRST